jgi:hypothetical protein
VLAPNSTAAANASKPPRTAGKRGGNKSFRDELITGPGDH